MEEKKRHLQELKNRLLEVGAIGYLDARLWLSLLLLHPWCNIYLCLHLAYATYSILHISQGACLWYMQCEAQRQICIIHANAEWYIQLPEGCGMLTACVDSLLCSSQQQEHGKDSSLDTSLVNRLKSCQCFNQILWSSRMKSFTLAKTRATG